ncbi:tRNA (adenosine(37)-N6)-threonylcarbamoyltransferase complex ATPase subunit type 1 TsaE [Sorangium sp. So ce854]|uniref:tRNA (adenosine(37)-N6)-threonylcarbamoyltransferase complex ATPase subunit type 1 TsaE n=1 Tax=Sorangium sp. So ce854 TaxID=3133322 RepID=UPI003F636BC4
MRIELPTRRSTIRLARALAGRLAGGDLVVLAGDLGAGKTFFARALCRALGVPSAFPVTSPTFTLVHEHEGRVPIAHADAYRLGGASPAAGGASPAAGGASPAAGGASPAAGGASPAAGAAGDAAAELAQLGLRERRGEGALVVVEWGEPFVEALGGDALLVRLVAPADPAAPGRAAELRATGERSGAVLAALGADLAAPSDPRARGPVRGGAA